MRLATALGVSFCLLIAGVASAHTEAGAGSVSCATWTADRGDMNPARSLDETQWALGFLSGIGFVGAACDDPLHKTPFAKVMLWLDTYCLSNPLAPLSNATVQFWVVHPRGLEDGKRSAVRE